MPDLITDIGLPSLDVIDEADASERRNRRATLRGYYTPAEFVHALHAGIDSAGLTRQRRHYMHTLSYWRRRGHRTMSVAERFANAIEQVTGRSIRTCNDCDQVHWERDIVTANDGDLSVCESCFFNYRYCDECNEHYHRDYAEDHDHDHEPNFVTGSVCEAPSWWRRFALPLADGTTLQSDTDRRVIQKPAIGRSARRDIWEALMETLPYSDIEYERTHAQEIERDKWRSATSAWSVEMNNEPVWQTPAGNLTKRLRKFFIQRQIKLNDKLVERIGNIARAGMGSDTEFDLRVTRELNGSAAEYNHGDSCWWGSYSSSRCMLKQCGGFALLLYREWLGSTQNLVGRSWVIPLKRAEFSASRWQPTHNPREAVAYAVINSYYDDGNAHPAETLAELMGMEHRNVRFSFEHMFVNGDSCRLVAPRDVLDKMDDATLIELSYAPDCGCDWNVG